MTEPLLSVRDLTVEIPARQGLLRPVDGVSIDVGAGEILGVVGESGAGKSMLGNAIISLLEPPARVAAGSIWLKGRRIDRLAPGEIRRIRGREIGMVFQDPQTSLNPLLRIGDQLVETFRTHLDISVSKARQRAVEALNDVGIPGAEHRMDSYPHEFSGGMRQRVVIALALAAEPDLVIADEPTTALDVSVQAQILTLLRSLCRDRGAAVILVTHDMGVVAENADRVAVMYTGRVAEIGTVEQVLGSPNHPYTAGLMAATPAASSGEKRLRQIPGTMPRLTAIPAGCAFHPRCDRAEDKCRRPPPPPLYAQDDRSACWFPIRENHG